MPGKGLQNWLRMKGKNQFRQLALDLIVPFRKSVWLLVAWPVCLGLAQAGGGSAPPTGLLHLQALGAAALRGGPEDPMLAPESRCVPGIPASLRMPKIFTVNFTTICGPEAPEWECGWGLDWPPISTSQSWDWGAGGHHGRGPRMGMRACLKASARFRNLPGDIPGTPPAVTRQGLSHYKWRQNKTKQKTTTKKQCPSAFHSGSSCQ